NYHRKVDEAVLGLALERIARQPAAERTPGFGIVMGGTVKDASREAIAKTVSTLYEATKLGDEATRLELFKKATTASLAQSKDPLIQIARKLRPLRKEAEAAGERRIGKAAMLKP